MAIDDGEKLPAFLGIRRRHVHESLDIAANRGEWRAQLMRDIGNEVRTDGFEAFDIRDIMENQNRSLEIFLSIPQTNRVDAKPALVVELDFLCVGLGRKIEGQYLFENSMNLGVARDFQNGCAVNIQVIANMEHSACLLVHHQDTALGIEQDRKSVV